MICMMCGRELPDDAVICKGCGSPQRRQPRPKPASLTETMTGEVRMGKKHLTVWQLCACAVSAIALLCLVVAFGPTLWASLADKLDSLETVIPDAETPIVQQSAEIDKVSGAILSLTVQLSNTEDTSEKAYQDGSWERDVILDNQIKIRLLRFAHQDDWTSTHLRTLYPDVSELEAFPELEDVSGYSGIRYQISSTAQAENCVVELLMVNTAEYDHFFIVEIPTDVFFDYETSIDDWMSRLSLIDADTLAELPAVSDSVSNSDVSDADISTADAAVPRVTE